MQLDFRFKMIKLTESVAIIYIYIGSFSTTVLIIRVAYFSRGIELKAITRQKQSVKLIQLSSMGFVWQLILKSIYVYMLTDVNIEKDTDSC